jgi:branched-chain amino acid transport system substrate-binding protein
MVMVAAAAAKKAGTTDAVKLREAMRAEGGYPGLTAPTISFFEHKSYPVKTVPVIGFENGKRVLLTDAMPTKIPYLK